MINALQSTAVYLITGYTDMRKAINGLSLIVSEQLGHDPFDGSLFVFCNKGRDKLKILHWQHNGFWLYYRRLEKGKFKWPINEIAGEHIALSYRELSWLLDGLSLLQNQAHPAVSGFSNN
ncbi:MAG: IS66 family insertion sequence element accessory protein TnpB [Gammaproteobacteria bacterium]|nr:IS66 family insertion sequence element accessory protein TnpB [Gammaproteobacteria bacterium]